MTDSARANVTPLASLNLRVGLVNLARYGPTTRSDRLVAPLLPLLAGDEGVRLLVADELLLHRVPRQLAAEPHGDPGQVADARRPVTDLRVADGLLPRLHRLEEVPHVIGAHRQPHVFVGELVVENLRLARLDLAAGDEQPAVRPLELDAVRQLARLPLTR